MVNILKPQIINIILRGLSLISKFLLLMYMAKFFSAEDLGIYGLFTATITVISLVIGFELHNYNNRAVLELPQNQRLQFIKNQMLFYCLMYIVALPFIPLLSKFGLIPSKYLFFLYVILVLDNLTQQFYRFFIVLAETVIANVALFIKLGIWCYILLIIWSCGEFCPKNLFSIFIFWSLSLLFALIFSIIKTKNLNLGKVDFLKIDFENLKTGLKVAMPFWVSGLLAVIINFSGQYIINFYLDKASVGVYTFFFNIANTINILLHTALIIDFYPKLIVANIENNQEMFLSVVKKYAKLIFLSSFIVCLGLAIFIKPVLLLIGKEQFNSGVSVFYLLMIANIIYNIMYIPHCVLYAKKSDIILTMTAVFGVIINFAVNLIFIPKYGIQVAGWSLLISYLFMLALRMFFVLKNKYLSA